MDLLISGATIFVVGAVLFWYCLPRGGRTHRFVGTRRVLRWRSAEFYVDAVGLDRTYGRTLVATLRAT